jgi:hypothetical protein
VAASCALSGSCGRASRSACKTLSTIFADWRRSNGWPPPNGRTPSAASKKQALSGRVGARAADPIKKSGPCSSGAHRGTRNRNRSRWPSDAIGRHQSGGMRLDLLDADGKAFASAKTAHRGDLQSHRSAGPNQKGAREAPGGLVGEEGPCVNSRGPSPSPNADGARPLPHDARQSQTWGSFPECDRPAPRRLQINYLTILYMVTPSPLGQTPCLTGTTNLVVTGTTTAPHASDRVAKKAPLQINPLQTPAPSLAKTK